MQWPFFAYAIVPAQSLFKPGFIIKENGEKVTGEIDFRDWNKNPVSINFKNAINVIENLSVNDLKVVEIPGFVRYEKAIVAIGNRPVHTSEIETGFEVKTPLIL